MRVEEWKDIKDYEGLYQISSYGRVKSLKRVINHTGSYGGKVTIPEKIRTARIGRNGYFYLVLNKNGKQKTFKIHRLVAEHFLKKIDGKEYVNHIDGNKLNNNVDNLEWCTMGENNKHAFEKGLKHIWNKGVFGGCNSNVKPIIQLDKNGIEINRFDCIMDASRILNIKYNMIFRVLRKKRKYTHGFVFKYIDKKEGDE